MVFRSSKWDVHTDEFHASALKELVVHSIEALHLLSLCARGGCMQIAMFPSIESSLASAHDQAAQMHASNKYQIY